MGRHFTRTRRRVLAVAGILTLLGGCAVHVPAYRINAVNVPQQSLQLPNGMRVVVQPEASLPKTTVVMRYDVGSAHDPEGRAGLAHLVEHLAHRVGEDLIEKPKVDEPLDDAPKATTSSEEDNVEPKKSKGKRRITYRTSGNAFTTVDETVYYQSAAPTHLKKLLESFAEQMGDFTPELSDAVFETERDVVRNERKERVDDGPYNRFSLDIHEHFYPKGHPYQGLGPSGSDATVSSITRDDVSAFLRKHYHASNATMVITGPVEAQSTLDLVTTLFGAKPALTRSKLEAPPWGSKGLRRQVVEVPSARHRFLSVSWPVGPALSDEALAAHFLCGRAPVFSRLAGEREFAFWAACSVEQNVLASRLTFYAMLTDDVNEDRVVNKILDSAEDLPTGREEFYLQARRQQIYREMMALETPRDRALLMAESFSLQGSPTAWNELLGRLEALDVDAIKALGKKILQRDRAFVMVLTPQADEEPEEAEDDTPVEQKDVEISSKISHKNRDLPEDVYDYEWPFASFRTWAMRDAGKWAEAQEHTLPNGIRYRVVQHGDFPIMSINAAFRGGKIAEPPKHNGVAKFTMRSMGLAGSQPNQRWYRMGISDSGTASDEYVNYSARFLSAHGEDALKLVVKKLSAPVFSGRSIRLQAKVETWTLEEEESDLDDLATRALWKSRGLEYLAPRETARSVRTIGYREVKNYYNSVIYPENMVLTVVSDLPVARTQEMVERTFGTWEPTGREPLQLGQRDAGSKKSPPLVLVEADSTQTKLLLAFPASGWRDWKESYVMDAVADVLKEEASKLREAMGITYGARVGTKRWEHQGVILLSSKVDAEDSETAITTLYEIMEKLRGITVDAGLLDSIKRDLIGDLVHEKHTTSSYARGHMSLMHRERARGFREDAIKWVASLSAADVQNAIRDVLGAQPTLVVVGPQPGQAAGSVSSPAAKPEQSLAYEPRDLFGNTALTRDWRLSFAPGFNLLQRHGDIALGGGINVAASHPVADHVLAEGTISCGRYEPTTDDSFEARTGDLGQLDYIATRCAFYPGASLAFGDDIRAKIGVGAGWAFELREDQQFRPNVSSGVSSGEEVPPARAQHQFIVASRASVEYRFTDLLAAGLHAGVVVPVVGGVSGLDVSLGLALVTYFVP